MTIKVGDKIPDVTFMKATPNGPEPVESKDFFKGRKSFVDGVLRSPLVKALEGGSVGVLNVAATCAGAVHNAVGFSFSIERLKSAGVNAGSSTLQAPTAQAQCSEYRP